MSYRGNPNIWDELFRKYFYSSELPQKEDAFELHSRLQHLIECHRHMEKNINVLNITLEALRRNCDDLSGVVDSYRSLFSPIKRLPDDVLGEIFLQAAPTQNAIPVFSESPLLLTLVCRRWRIVAQSTPRLWSKLHIVLPHKREENIDGDEEYLRRWSYVSLVKRLLRLSGNAPLSLSISVSQGCGPCTDMSPTAKELLITVIKHSARWSEVDLFCSSDAFNFLNSEMVKDTPQPSLPLLRRVRVEHIIDPDCLPSGSSGALYPYTSSALRELSLSLCYTITPFLLRLLQPVSWRLLTHLSIHRYASGPQWLLSILPQCEQLEAFLLDMREACHDDSVGPRHLPKLQSLSLQGTQEYIDDFVGCLETPLLTQFTFYADRWNDNAWHVPNAPQLAPRFLWFLTQCGQIQSLTLSPHILSVEMFVAIVEAVPGITTLTINNSTYPFLLALGDPRCYSEIPNPLETFLLQASDTSPDTSPHSPFLLLLPNLRNLSFSNLYTPHSLSEAILAFCKSRLSRFNTANAGPPLASLNCITMTLMKHKNDINLGEALCRYVDSIGRKLGDDLTLDITYPWEADSDDSSASSDILDPRYGVDDGTNSSWNLLDA